MGIDIQAPVNNLPHIDRIQSDSHRLPVVHQEHNVENARDEAARRTTMPVQPDEAEGKNIDPEDKAARDNTGRKPRKRHVIRQQRQRPRGGSIIDVDA